MVTVVLVHGSVVMVTVILGTRKCCYGNSNTGYQGVLLW